MTSPCSQLANSVSTVKFAICGLRAEKSYDELRYMRTLEKECSRRVLALIEEKKTSQEALAPKAGISKNYLSELINGKRRWNIQKIESVADALGVPAWQLMIDPREVIPASYRKLMEDYCNLDADGKRLVDGLLFAAAHAAEEKKSVKENSRPKKAS